MMIMNAKQKETRIRSLCRVANCRAGVTLSVAGVEVARRTAHNLLQFDIEIALE